MSFTLIASLITSFLAFSETPNGVMNGRDDVRYGTYSSVVQESARKYQDRIDAVSSKVYGLSWVVNYDEKSKKFTAPQFEGSLDAPTQAKELFLLEVEIAKVLIEVSNASKGNLTDAERKILTHSAARVYKDVRHHSEKVFENMVRYIDHKLPGPNGQQIRVDSGVSVYEPNYRSDKDLTEEEKSKLYKEKLDEFTKNGGSMNEIFTLNDDALKRMNSFNRYEYVWMPNNEIRLTTGKAGHILLAHGKAVKSAGQIVFIKNNQGDIVFLVVSNASGSYKPDLVHAEDLLSYVEKKFFPERSRSPYYNSYVTKGEPLSTQAVKIFLKADGVKNEEIKKVISSIEDPYQSSLGSLTYSGWQTPIFRCGSVFSN